MKTCPGNSLLLASGSVIRRTLLEDAGLEVIVRPVDLDEEVLRKDCTEKGLSLEKTAVFLADSKAIAATDLAEKGTFILAADQILDLEGVGFSKPTAISEARDQLLALRGRVHILQTAIVLWRDGKKLWEHLSAPRLTMRMFSEAFLDAYLRKEGEKRFSPVWVDIDLKDQESIFSLQWKAHRMPFWVCRACHCWPSCAE